MPHTPPHHAAMLGEQLGQAKKRCEKKAFCLNYETFHLHSSLLHYQAIFTVFTPLPVVVIIHTSINVYHTIDAHPVLSCVQ